MDRHIREYYQQSSDGTPQGSFHSVIPLHNAPDVFWEAIHAKIPTINRGWYELAQLGTKDRIDFTRDFWLSKLPYRVGFSEFLDRFFSSLDDIGIFITQKKFDDPYEVHMVYSVKGDGGFFRGRPPISEKEQSDLEKMFEGVQLPADYLAFLQIHNGFCKATDCTGITPAGDVYENFQNLQDIIRQQQPLETSKGTAIDPRGLVPFYESFGMPFFQCFWSEWYPEQEMGNVYYSGEANTISDVYGSGTSSELMAFPTFVDWLMFYLERVE